jgi:hypothetical protein
VFTRHLLSDPIIVERCVGEPARGEATPSIRGDEC